MQTSMVFSQLSWPGVGDIDDCWAVSSIQCVNVVAPQLRLVSVPTFRVAAGNPDQPGPTGGDLGDTVQGVETLFPVFAGKLRKLRGWSWDDFVDRAKDHHPMSVSVINAKMPTRCRFGFNIPASYHRISVVVKADGHWLVANPLAKPYSRWCKVNPAEIRDAVMAYGKAREGTRGVWAVSFPTDDQLEPALDGLPDDLTPFDQEDIDSATAVLEARIKAAQDALEGGTQ